MCRAESKSRRRFSLLPFITPGRTGGEILPQPQPQLQLEPQAQPQPQPVDSVNSKPFYTVPPSLCACRRAYKRLLGYICRRADHLRRVFFIAGEDRRAISNPWLEKYTAPAEQHPADSAAGLRKRWLYCILTAPASSG